MATPDLEDFFSEAGGDTPNAQNLAKHGIQAPPAPPQTRREMHRQEKQRKRRRRTRRIIIIVLFIAFIFGAWFVFSRLNTPAPQQKEQEVVQDYPGPGTGSVEFTVQQGESTASIAERLAKEDIVSSATVFTQAVLNVDAQAKLQPGSFLLKYRMSAPDVVEILVNPANATGMLQVTSDARVADVIVEAAQLSGIDQSEFQAVIDGGGSGILPAEAKGTFEGWLEPGSYDVSQLGSASDILKAMVDRRVEKLDELKVPTGAERQRIITIASIVEGEVNQQQYYGKVARVIENRLDQDMSLGMDSVVAYGNNVAPRALTNAMLQDTTNPYNSRIQKGLPPTPINNPSDATIQAAMAPEDGDWLYFVTVNLDTGETKFTADIDEFNKFAQEYQTWEQNN